MLDEALILRSLARSTREEYHRYVRKLGERAQCDPARSGGIDTHAARDLSQTILDGVLLGIPRLH